MHPDVLVTEVTRAATVDSLTDEDYYEIFEELRGQHTLRQFVELAHTRYSIAWWSKIERRETPLTRQAKNDLRHAVGMPTLPLTVEEATAGVDPDAVIYQVGEHRPNRVILVGHPKPLRMVLNGVLDVSEKIDVMPPDPRVTPVTRRNRRHTVSLRPELWQRLNVARVAAGVPWDKFLTTLLDMATSTGDKPAQTPFVAAAQAPLVGPAQTEN